MKDAWLQGNGRQRGCPGARLLVGVLLVLASLGVCAAEPYDDGYVRVLVPDMSQAETFFQDVLDCRRMTPDDAGSHAGCSHAKIPFTFL